MKTQIKQTSAVELTTQQLQAALDRVSGVSDTEILQKYKISTATWYRWRENTAFADYCWTLHRAAEQMTIENLFALRAKAITRLNKIIEVGGDKDALKAIELVFGITSNGLEKIAPPSYELAKSRDIYGILGCQ